MRAFERRPRASLALRIAERLHGGGRIGSAANWAERALAVADDGGAHAAASRLLDKLRWPLRDAGYGNIEFTVSPASALLVIDDQAFLPRRARYRIWLPAGSHQLHVSLSGYGTVERIVSAQPGEDRSISVALADQRPATIELRISPVTAEVWIDSAYAGLSTKRSFSVKPGDHVVELRAEGFEGHTKTLTLAPASTHLIEVMLDRVGAQHRSRPTASSVDRELTPMELANRGERHRLGHRPYDRLRDPAAGPGKSKSETSSGGAGGAEGAPPAPHRPEPVEAAPPPSRVELPDAQESPAEATEEPEAPEAAVEETASGPMSTRLKGVLWTAIGVAIAGAGVGTSVYGVQQATIANSLRLGHKEYASYYDYGAKMTYAGYGAAGVGAIATGVGVAYLFAGDGLSRSGKGWFLLGSGAVAGGVGGWLALGARDAAVAAEAMPLRDPRYVAAYEGATANWRAGVIAAGVGGVALLAGAWLLLTDGGGGGGSAGSYALVPSLGPGHGGAALQGSF